MGNLPGDAGRPQGLVVMGSKEPIIDMVFRCVLAGVQFGKLPVERARVEIDEPPDDGGSPGCGGLQQVDLDMAFLLCLGGPSVWGA